MTAKHYFMITNHALSRGYGPYDTLVEAKQAIRDHLMPGDEYTITETVGGEDGTQGKIVTTEEGTYVP